MSETPILTKEISILLLLLVASLGAVAFKRLNFPYTVGLVIIGLVLGFLTGLVSPLESFTALSLSPHLILYIFVPPLIFESAINLDNKLLLQTLAPSMTLAGPGLLLSAGIMGGFLSWVTPLSFSEALLFGALVSATDPVAVIALFKQLGAPRRLMMLVEGESMLNDATAIVLFDVILVVITQGQFGFQTLEQASLEILITLAGGIVVGVVIATVMRLSISLAEDDYAIQLTISGLIAYTAFLVSEHYLEFSGVIAVMSAGLVVGGYCEYTLKPDVRKHIQEFWEYAAFIANSLIFLLVGLKTSDFLVDLNANNSTFWLAIVSAIALAIITRGVVIFLLIPLVNRFQPSNPINWRFQLVTIWGGLRGAIALALALSLSNDFPHRQLIVAMTLGVAVFTILVSGSTIGKLVRWLGLDQLSKREELARVQARVFIQKETLELSKELEKRPFFEQSIVDELKQDYEQNLQQAEASAAKFWETLRADPVQMRQVFWLQVVQIEHHAYRELHDEGVISELALKKLSVMMNWKGDAVLSNQIPPPIAKTRTLETPLRKLIVNRLLLLIPKRYWLANRRIKELAFRYEYYAAIMYVSKKVVKIIKQLAHQQAVDEDVASQCIEFYEKNGDAALNWINTFVEDHPELAFPMQKQVIKRATLRRQSETLDSLADRGIIPEKDLENLREQLLEKKPNL